MLKDDIMFEKLHGKRAVRKLFVLAATALCGHVLAGMVGVYALSHGSAYKSVDAPENHVKLTLQDKKHLQQGLEQSLGDAAPPFTLIGKSNHCDERQEEFIADYKTLELLAKKGIKTIFVELPTTDQKQINEVASGAKSSFSSESSPTCGEGVAAQEDAVYTMLIKNAASLGMGVYASEVGYTGRTFLYEYNALGMDIEADVISLVNRKKGDEWSRLGWVKFVQDRDNEKVTAAFITAHSSAGPGLIDFGSSHVTNDTPDSLRKLLPQNTKSLVIAGAQKTETDALTQTMCESGKGGIDVYGAANRPPDVVLKLSPATVERCSQ